MSSTPKWPPMPDADDEPEPSPNEAAAEFIRDLVDRARENMPALDRFLDRLAALPEPVEGDPDTTADDAPSLGVQQEIPVVEPPRPAAVATPTSNSKLAPPTAVAVRPAPQPAANRPSTAGKARARLQAPSPPAAKRKPDPPCTTDPFSIEGLRRLAKTRPRDWHTVFRPGFPTVGTASDPTDTVRDVLAGRYGRLWPQRSTTTTLNRLRRRRIHARVIDRVIGDRPALSIGRPARKRLQELLPLCPPEAVRATTMLSGLLLRWRNGLDPALRKLVALPGQEPHPPLPDPPADRPGRPATSKLRPIVDPSRVAKIMLHCDHHERVAYAFGAGCGMREGEVARLRETELLLIDRAWVWPDEAPRRFLDLWIVIYGAPGGKHAGRSRVVVAPRWVAEILSEAGIQAGTKSLAPVLPTKKGGFRVSLQGISRSVARRLRGTGLQPLTWSDLRATWQARAAQHGLPREVERGTWWLPDTDDWIRDSRCSGLAYLAERWATLAEPATPSGQHPTKLRRRAPSHCPPNRAERKVKWRPPPLPASAMPARAPTPSPAALPKPGTERAATTGTTKAPKKKKKPTR